LQLSAKRRNENILEEAGERQLWNSVVARKLRYFGHIMRKEDENLEKCIITGMAEGTRGRGRPRRAWSDDIKEWTNNVMYICQTEKALQLPDQGLRSLEKRCPSCRQRSRRRIRHQRRQRRLQLTHCVLLVNSDSVRLCLTKMR